MLIEVQQLNVLVEVRVIRNDNQMNASEQIRKTENFIIDIRVFF